MSPVFTKPNVLVTGGAGFLGSHVCEALLKHNKVICVDNFISGSERNINHLLENQDFEFIRHDMNTPLDFATLPALNRFKVQFQGIQEVWHLACPNTPGKADEHAIETLSVCSMGTLNALKIAQQYNAKFLFASSAVVYGPRTSETPLKEEDEGIVNLFSSCAAYDEGKRFGEMASFMYQQRYQFPVRVARLFGIYGPRMAVGQGNLVADLIDHAITNDDLVLTGNPKAHASLCYVSDVVDALIKMMSETRGFVLLNIGSDQPVTLQDVAQCVVQVTSSTSAIYTQEGSQEKLPLALPDIHKARETISWFPLVPLDDGIRRTYDYILAHKGILGM